MVIVHSYVSLPEGMSCECLVIEIVDEMCFHYPVGNHYWMAHNFYNSHSNNMMILWIHSIHYLVGIMLVDII